MTEAVSGLSGLPTAVLQNSDGEVLTTSNDFTVTTNSNDSAASVEVVFLSLRSTQGFQYTCVGGSMVLGSRVTEVTRFTVVVRCESLLISIIQNS